MDIIDYNKDHPQGEDNLPTSANADTKTPTQIPNGSDGGDDTTPSDDALINNPFNVYPPDDDDDKDNDDDIGVPATMSFNPAPKMIIPTHLSPQQLDEDNEPERPDCLINYNQKASTFDKAMFRDEEFTKMITVLKLMKKANALLLGDPGVGKTQLVEEFARRYVIDGDLELREHFGDDLQIEELNISALISGKSLVGQLEKEFNAVLEYASKNNVIIFIDEIHRLFSDTSTNNVAQDMKKALSRSDVQFIGATTLQESGALKEDPAFSRRWTEVQVAELTPEQSKEILATVKNKYQKHHGVIIPDSVLSTIVRFGDRYKTPGSHRPDSSLTLMDKACSAVNVRHTKISQSNDPYKDDYLKATRFPTVSKDDIIKAAKSLNKGNNIAAPSQPIEDALNDNIVGQDKAKEAISKTIRHTQLNLVTPKRPHSFLFAGPTGTGKTEIARQLAKYLFDDPDAMIRLDMTEFTDPASMNRIKGSPDGYVGSTSKQQLPFDSLQTTPEQIILLDELEKAHPSIRMLFMQILEGGKFETERHTVIDFSRTIIIATTNAGMATLNDPVIGFNKPKAPTQSEVKDALSETYPIELLNRFEHIVSFDAITKPQYKQILALKYNMIVKEAKQNRPDLRLYPEAIDMYKDTDLALLEELADSTYDPTFNGRPAERTIQSYIEEQIIANPSEDTLILFEH